MAQGTVYLIHFETPHEHARHYLGWTSDLEARLSAHAHGRGSALMAEIKRQGIAWSLARTWPGDRHFERKLKRRKNAPRLCPTCREAA